MAYNCLVYSKCSSRFYSKCSSRLLIFFRIETCNFSGFKIYPGHGSLFVRSDSRIYRFVNSKNKSLFLQRKKPAKFDWTIVFRRLHKKGQDVESTKKKGKKTVKVRRKIRRYLVPSTFSRLNLLYISETDLDHLSIWIPIIKYIEFVIQYTLCL